MLSEHSKKSIAANIFSDCLDGFKELTTKHMNKAYVNSWESFFESVQYDFEYMVERCKFVYESFPALKEDDHYVEIYNRLNNWTPCRIFQRYGQPEKMSTYFFFDKFRFQTEEEAKKSNDLAMEILNEIIEDETINDKK